MSRINERRRSLAVVFFAVLVATFALTMASMSSARADGVKCDRAAFADDTGYLACLMGSGSGGGSGSVETSSEDLPVTGAEPIKYMVMGAAFIAVGVAAVVGSTQAKRRSRTAS